MLSRTIAALSVVMLLACERQQPLAQLQKQLNKFPEYSIALNDMKEEGNFIRHYYHQYKITVLKTVGSNDYQQVLSDWLTVTADFYRKHTGNLGMVLATKDGNNQAQPPGYNYVGNPQYGRWVENNNGTSFWEFYGKYALLSSMFGMMGRPVYHDDYRSYRHNRERGRSYYGRNGEFGSTGTETRKQHKNFYQRRQQRERLKRQAFGQRVRNRATRSHHSGFRRRSFGGFGK